MREVILMQSNKKEPKSLSIGIWKQMFPDSAHIVRNLRPHLV